jgi:hypothetical protein
MKRKTIRRVGTVPSQQIETPLWGIRHHWMGWIDLGDIRTFKHSGLSHMTSTGVMQHVPRKRNHRPALA